MLFQGLLNLSGISDTSPGGIFLPVLASHSRPASETNLRRPQASSRSLSLPRRCVYARHDVDAALHCIGRVNDSQLLTSGLSINNFQKSWNGMRISL